MSYLECPKCGQKALSVATQCPRCHTPFEGHSAPRRPPTPPGLIIGVAVAILIIVGGVARRVEIAADYMVPPAKAPARAPRPPAESVAVTSPPAASHSLRPATADSARTPALPAPTTPPASPRPSNQSPTGEHRYARTWVNVRSGPSGKAPIVRILQPGESVQVDSLRDGWYQVLANGGPGGYVDGNLVDTSRPSPSHTP